MSFKDNNILNKEYDAIYIVENRDFWKNCNSKYNADCDLVFTLDFGLKNKIEKEGGEAYYLDYILESNFLEGYNYKVHEFLDNWHSNSFVYNNINLGSSFLLDIINDVNYYVHFFINILAIKKLNKKHVVCGLSDKHIKEIISENIPNAEFIEKCHSRNNSFFFPIGKWMEEKVNKTQFTDKVKNAILSMLDFIFLQKNLLLHSNKSYIYFQNYFPTRDIVEDFQEKSSVKIFVDDYSKYSNLFRVGRIRARAKYTHSKTKLYTDLFNTFDKQSLLIEGVDISPKLYEIIFTVFQKKISKCLIYIDLISKIFNKFNFKLIVPVCNYWMENRLIIEYGLKHNIPVFMVINGILAQNFSKDGRDSTFVNSYSKVIKEDFFHNAENVHCLGDPRMDNYAKQSPKQVNRLESTIIIGAAGFSPYDLNAYLAYEFDFLNDILCVLSELKEKDYKSNIVLKVRNNGYTHQYRSFIDEYFPTLNIEIIQQTPFVDVITRADLYITFYSQTVFEASCLGIPSIYYKKDSQIVNRPFDGTSELVTAFDKASLNEKVIAFYNSDNCFDAFLRKEVMEKYVGPLDGKNRQRNCEFINGFIHK